MPIYEYSCEECGRIIERIQKFSDPLLTQHEGCGGALTKLISQSAFHLKGDGWYVTDYARKEKPEEQGEIKKEEVKQGSSEDKDLKKKPSSGESSKEMKASGEKSSTKQDAPLSKSNTKPSKGAS